MARLASVVHNARGEASLLRRWVVMVNVRVQHGSPLASSGRLDVVFARGNGSVQNAERSSGRPKQHMLGATDARFAQPEAGWRTIGCRPSSRGAVDASSSSISEEDERLAEPNDDSDAWRINTRPSSTEPRSGPPPTASTDMCRCSPDGIPTASNLWRPATSRQNSSSEHRENIVSGLGLVSGLTMDGARGLHQARR